MPAVSAASMTLPPTAATAGFGLEQVRQLRSVADVNRLLHEASARERAIDGELEQLLLRRGELEERLLDLHNSTQEVRTIAVSRSVVKWVARGGPALQAIYHCRQSCRCDSCVANHQLLTTPILPRSTPPAPNKQMLQVTKAEAEALAGSTADTAALAEKVSRKVRELDTAQSRVQATLGHIGVVLDRLHAVEGIQSALQREDWEAAAQCVARYLELEDELAAAGVAGGAAGTAEAAAALAPPDADGRQAQEQARVSARPG